MSISPNVLSVGEQAKNEMKGVSDVIYVPPEKRPVALLANNSIGKFDLRLGSLPCRKLQAASR